MALDNHASTSICRDFRIAEHLDCVSEALFRVDQKGFACQILATPSGVGELAAFERRGFPARFVLVPPLLKITEEEIGEATIPLRAEVIRVEFELAVVSCNAF